MITTPLERCPGCAAILPHSNGPTHRYLGASSACWALYSALSGAGEPTLAPNPLRPLLVDAYAAQHPGTPSDQATQSVAVHLLALYGVLVRGMPPEKALWIRQRAVRLQGQPKHSRFGWLTPPSFAGSLTIVDIVEAPTPSERSERVTEYIHSVWQIWAKAHVGAVARWYEQFVEAD
jgi:hypothetical protein